MFFYTTCLWPLPVHTWMFSGIIIPPLLHDPGRNSICVIHQLETSDIGSTLPEFGQVNVHESLVEERNRRSLSEEDISKWEGGPCLCHRNMADSSGKISSLWEEMSNSEDTTVPQPWCELAFFTGYELAGHTLQSPPREINNYINNSSLARKLAE